jgi:4-aminobutyrate aminotransferase
VRDRAVLGDSLERGLLTLGCGKKMIRLPPRLDATHCEIEMGTSIFLDAAAAAE